MALRELGLAEGLGRALSHGTRDTVRTRHEPDAGSNANEGGGENSSRNTDGCSAWWVAKVRRLRPS